jgi:hypothetical protein
MSVRMVTLLELSLLKAWRVGDVERHVEDEDRAALDEGEVLRLGREGDRGDDQDEQQQQGSAEDQEEGRHVGEKGDEELFHSGLNDRGLP